MKRINDSKEKILDTACKLFAEKGYKETTVRDICKEANTYQVSINYYFGSKEMLFKEAFKLCIKHFNEFTSQIDSEKLSADKKLKKMVTFGVKAVFADDEKGWFFKFIAKNEKLIHSDLIIDVLEDLINRNLATMKILLSELLSREANSFEVTYFYFIFVSQISTINRNPKFRVLLFENKIDDEQEHEKVINQITEFMLCGMQSMKTLKEGI